MNALFDKSFALSIGPQRAGAHYIYDYLAARADVCLPAGVKEIFFFDRHFRRGAGFYESHFAVRDRHTLIAEVSTTSFDHPDAPRRVFETFGNNVSLVCPLRHPVARSMAVYQDYLRYGIVSGGIEEAAEQAPQILFSSRYADHLENWFEVFGQEGVKILFYEDAERHIEDYLQAFCTHIGLPYQPAKKAAGVKASLAKLVPKFKPRNVLPAANLAKRQAAQTWLQSRLLPEILKLENLLGETLPHWKH